MSEIIIYTKAVCPYCEWAKKLLDNKKASYREIRIDNNESLQAEVIRLSGRRTVPQIFINGEAIGGFDDLSALDKAGKLDILLKPHKET